MTKLSYNENASSRNASCYGLDTYEFAGTAQEAAEIVARAMESRSLRNHGVDIKCLVQVEGSQAIITITYPAYGDDTDTAIFNVA